MPHFAKPEKNRKMLLFTAVYLAVLGVAGVFLLVELWFIWAALLAAGVIMLGSWYTSRDPHSVLKVFVGLNVVLDVLAIAIWAAFPATQWSIYQLGFTVVGAEAAVAAALFAVTFLGVRRKKKWAPYLAIALTIIQRCFAAYVFFPSTAIPVTTVWTGLIVYYAYRTIKTQKH